MSNLQHNIIMFDFLECIHSKDEDMDNWEMSLLKYHASWDYLMPIYHKCVAKTNESKDMHLAFNEAFYDMLVFNNIQWLYEACLNFIQYYNTKTKNRAKDNNN